MLEKKEAPTCGCSLSKVPDPRVLNPAGGETPNPSRLQHVPPTHGQAGAGRGRRLAGAGQDEVRDAPLPAYLHVLLATFTSHVFPLITATSAVTGCSARLPISHFVCLTRVSSRIEQFQQIT